MPATTAEFKKDKEAFEKPFHHVVAAAYLACLRATAGQGQGAGVDQKGGSKEGQPMKDCGPVASHNSSICVPAVGHVDILDDHSDKFDSHGNALSTAHSIQNISGSTMPQTSDTSTAHDAT